MDMMRIMMQVNIPGTNNGVLHMCPNCNSSNLKEILRIVNDRNLYLVPELSGVERAWFKCETCLVYFSSPELNSSQIAKMYEIYRAVEFRGETEDAYFDRITSYSPEDSENFYKVKYMASVVRNPKEVLDIGCGGGVLINSMKKNWPEANFWGCEPSPNFCDLTSRRTSAITRNSLYTAETFPNQTFDLITCCQVFEHVKDLTQFVRAIRSNMHPQSHFYLEVPDVSDFDYLDPAHSRFTEPSHLWYFGENFLRRLFTQELFEVICSKTERTIRGRNNLTLILSKH